MLIMVSLVQDVGVGRVVGVMLQAWVRRVRVLCGTVLSSWWVAVRVGCWHTTYAWYTVPREWGLG